jgi:hypothetical protein
MDLAYDWNTRKRFVRLQDAHGHSLFSPKKKGEASPWKGSEAERNIHAHGRTVDKAFFQKQIASPR